MPVRLLPDLPLAPPGRHGLLDVLARLRAVFLAVVAAELEASMGETMTHGTGQAWSDGELIRRYTDILGQYDRTVLHDDDGAAQRLAEVSDALIMTARRLIERFVPQADPGWLDLDEDPDMALAVIEDRMKGDRAYAALCLADAIRHGCLPAGWSAQ